MSIHLNYLKNTSNSFQDILYILTPIKYILFHTLSKSDYNEYNFQCIFNIFSDQ